MLYRLYCETFGKRRVSKTIHKELNLNVGYSEHSQRGVSINLPKETSSKQKKERKIDFNIKERIEKIYIKMYYIPLER